VYGKPHTCRQHRAAFNGGVTHRRPARIRLAGLLLVIAAIAALGQQWPASSSSTAAHPIDVLRGERPSSRGETGGAVPERTISPLSPSHTSTLHD